MLGVIRAQVSDRRRKTGESATTGLLCADRLIMVFSGPGGKLESLNQPNAFRMLAFKPIPDCGHIAKEVLSIEFKESNQPDESGCLIPSLEGMKALEPLEKPGCLSEQIRALAIPILVESRFFQRGVVIRLRGARDLGVDPDHVLDGEVLHRSHGEIDCT